jgi:hypothetical protein
LGNLLMRLYRSLLLPAYPMNVKNFERWSCGVLDFSCLYSICQPNQRLTYTMKTTTLIVTGLSISLLGLLGVSRCVSAKPSPTSIVAQTQSQQKESNDGDQETNDDAKDRQESAQLQALAKITPQQAQRAAIVTQSQAALSPKPQQS